MKTKLILLIATLAQLTFVGCTENQEERKPNILWLLAEDLSPYIGCYGDTINAGHTPVIDKLASEGVRFSRTYMPAPVCSSCRSGLITGVFSTSIGAQNHTSSRYDNGVVVPEKYRIHLPDSIIPIPQLMREAGYFTFNSGKDDYNFHYDRRALYSYGTKANYEAGMNGWFGNTAISDNVEGIAPWNEREDKNQPWFGQFTLRGGKGPVDFIREGEILEANEVPIPPYYPNTPTFRKMWTDHYNAVRGTDVEVERILKRLEADGELENTIVIFFSDHGNNHSLRHKQFCYEGGVQVPLIIAGNHKWLKGGVVREEIISGLDVTATTLALAGVELPSYLHGQNLFGENYKAKDYIISARDRCDFTTKRIRTVRSDKYRYIRNFYPERTMLQPAYRDKQPVVVDLKILHSEGKLTAYQDEFWFGARPVEELYDMENDPYQMNNLALDSDYAEILIEHRDELTRWIKETNDHGQYPESEVQLEANFRRWKEKPVFKEAGVVPEYVSFY